MDRDIVANPYRPDEQRVVDYLRSLMPDIGAGDDPIGFLIASHQALSELRRHGDREDAWAAL